MATATPLTATATRLRLRSTITRLQHTVTERWHRPRAERTLLSGTRLPPSQGHRWVAGITTTRLAIGAATGAGVLGIGGAENTSSDSLAHRIGDRNGARSTALSERPAGTKP